MPDHCTRPKKDPRHERDIDRLCAGWRVMWTGSLVRQGGVPQVLLKPARFKKLLSWVTEGGCSTNLDETLRLWYTTHWLEVSYDCGVFFHRAASFEETLP